MNSLNTFIGQPAGNDSDFTYSGIAFPFLVQYICINDLAGINA